MIGTSSGRTEWRGHVHNQELHSLFEDAWGQPPRERDIVSRLEAHSLGWVTARDGDGSLLGFVNVAWDGSLHAFLLDTTVATASQREGVGAQLVGVAVERARKAGCQWLQVDFEPELRALYIDACGFDLSDAGIVDLGKN
jgi:GNAT superfamily N-acetyltransferase